MIAKKNSRKDLEKKRVILFQIGLLMASAFTLAAFTYETHTYTDEQLGYISEGQVEYQIVNKEEPEEEPEKQEDNADDQQDDQSDDQSQDASDENQDLNNAKQKDNAKQDVKSKVKKPKGGMKFTRAKVKNTKVYEYVDVDAAYIGGYVEMKKFIGENVEYPDDARIMGEQGKVYVSFVVETDGSISNVEVTKSVFGSIDREAKRLVRSFPKWKPGEVNYEKVRTKVSLPIVFTLATN